MSAKAPRHNGRRLVRRSCAKCGARSRRRRQLLLTAVLAQFSSQTPFEWPGQTVGIWDGAAILSRAAEARNAKRGTEVKGGKGAALSGVCERPTEDEEAEWEGR